MHGITAIFNMKNLFYAAIGIIILVVAWLAIVAAVISLFAWLFMILWNAFVVDLFNAPVVTYWNSIGITLIIMLIGTAFKTTINVKK